MSLLYKIDIVTNFICLGTLLILSILLCIRRKILRFYLLSLGIFLISIGSLYRLIFHSIFLSKLTLSEIKNILSIDKIPLAWYLDSIIINCGILLVVISFTLIIFVKEKE